MPSPPEAMARARPISPFTLIAWWGHAGRHCPQRMQPSSSISTSIGSSTATEMASVGQTRTQAKHATQSSASMTKFKDLIRPGGSLQFDGPTPDCQEIGVCKVCGQLELAGCIGLQSVGSQEPGVGVCGSRASYRGLSP